MFKFELIDDGSERILRYTPEIDTMPEQIVVAVGEPSGIASILSVSKEIETKVQDICPNEECAPNVSVSTREANSARIGGAICGASFTCAITDCPFIK